MTRVTEKKIVNLKKIIAIKEKNINEAELDFEYLTSPVELEKKINLIGFNNYQPIKHSKIYFNISHLTKVQNKISNFKKINGKKTQKN